MKKGILVLFVLLAGLAAPKLIGDMAKDSYLQGLDIYPSKDKQIQLEHKSYTQSWFSSQAVTMMHIAIDEPEMETLTAKITSTIQHGPILFTDAGLTFGAAYIQTDINWIGLPDAVQSFVDKHLVIRATSLIDFNHGSSDSINMNEFTYEDEEGSATFGGLIASGMSSLDYSLFKGNLQLPASRLVAEDIAINIADASSTYDFQKHQDLTFLGSIN
ncbi:MAG: DUF945 family protein, partial [Ghiorsea sp.]